MNDSTLKFLADRYRTVKYMLKHGNLSASESRQYQSHMITLEWLMNHYIDELGLEFDFSKHHIEPVGTQKCQK